MNYKITGSYTMLDDYDKYCDEYFMKGTYYDIRVCMTVTANQWMLFKVDLNGKLYCIRFHLYEFDNLNYMYRRILNVDFLPMVIEHYDDFKRVIASEIRVGSNDMWNNRNPEKEIAKDDSGIKKLYDNMLEMYNKIMSSCSKEIRCFKIGA
jgi:hypothetical protein